MEQDNNNCQFIFRRTCLPVFRARFAAVTAAVAVAATSSMAFLRCDEDEDASGAK